MTSLSIRGVEKKLGGAAILRGIDLDVAHGELVVLVGPSGCGKSTLLRTVAGLELPDGGSIHIGERDVTRLSPRERDVGMVFQSYALYPHLTVRENLAFGLTLRREKRATIDARIAEVASMLGLDALLDRYPRDMSGGQRQRVAMGRAIARRPSLYLFDEPLSNLDAALRAEVRVEIKRLHARLEATMLYVTHDQVEAMTLADRLVVLSTGRIEQVGPPLEVYARPRSRFVAGFLGSPAMNFVDVRRKGDRLLAPGLSVKLPEGMETPSSLVLGVRPHDLRAPRAREEGAEIERASERDTSVGTLELLVDVVEAMGFETYAYARLEGAPEASLASFIARLEGEAAREVRAGGRLSLLIEEAHLFDVRSGEALARVSHREALA